MANFGHPDARATRAFVILMPAQRAPSSSWWPRNARPEDLLFLASNHKSVAAECAERAEHRW